MNNSAVALRILDPKLTLTGASGDALENQIIDSLPNGAVCWVIAEAGWWYLSKSSLAAVGADVIATSRGAGARGRWIRAGTSGSGFQPTYAEIYLSNGSAFTFESGTDWQAMPTSELIYSAMVVQDIDLNGNTFTIPVDQPTGVFLCRAVLSWLGSETEDGDELRLSLAISKNGERIGTSLDAYELGRQTTSALFSGAGGEPGQTVNAERMIELVAGDTIQGIALPEAVAGNAQVLVRNYTFSIERLSAST